MRRRHLVGLLIVIAFIVFTAVTFRNTLTPYVTFAQARTMTGSVQVRGQLSNTQDITANGGRIQFPLRDERGEVVTVVYNGAKPDGLQQAIGIVAVGKYENGLFAADKLLVKCPSKYQASGKAQ